VRYCYLSLGSNMGDRGAYLRAGVAAMTEGVARTSPVYQTSPWGGVVQDDFWNIVLEIESSLSAEALLAKAQHAEREAQRVRDEHWGPRTLDVDLLLLGDEVYDTPDLVVPHPRMWLRRFVIAPLRDLRPDLVSESALLASDGEVHNIGTLETLH